MKHRDKMATLNETQGQDGDPNETQRQDGGP